MRHFALTALAGAALSATGHAQPLREGVGPGEPLTQLITSGDCRFTIIGDSISNKNTNTFAQSSYYWGIIRRWRPDVWAGICTPTNAQSPTIALTTPPAASVTFVTRSLSNQPDQRQFSYGYERISASATLDALWFADAPPGQAIVASRLLNNGEWRVGDWFDNAPMAATFVTLRSPQAIGSLQPRAIRGIQPPIAGTTLSLAGPLGVVGIEAPVLTAADGECEFRLVTMGPYDEAAPPDPDHFIWLTTRIRRTDLPGFQLDALAVGGSRLADWLADGAFATDERLREYLAATGNPNVFAIHLGANEAAFNDAWEQNLRSLIDRLDTLSTQNGASPWFLLVPPYGTLNSITHEQVLMAAAIEHRIATEGTTRVTPDRIAFINLPAMLKGPIDPVYLIDSIHPRPAGANLLASLLWQAITDEVFDDSCPADLTGTSDPNNPLYGVPDGVADVQDLFYFFDAFAANDIARADLTGSSDPNSPDYGIPDGVVDMQDFDYLVDAVNRADATRGDLTGAADPIDPRYGQPDGELNADDIFYFLDQFVAANFDRADLSGSTDPNDPAYGLPDGSLDAADFFYFLDKFQEGCP